MAKLVRPTEAYIEAEVWYEVSRPDHNGANPSTHKFQIEGEKVYLPNLGTTTRGTRYYMTYNELCELVAAYEKYAGIIEPWQ